MGFVDFFKGIGRVLAGAFHLIKKLVPEEQLVAAIELVRAAATHYATNEERRNAVIADLMARFHIPESVARFIVELAVQQVKNGIDKGIDAAEGAATSAE